MGINEYKWIAASMEPVVTCDIGLRNNGKIFSYERPPKEGHPCEGLCNSKGWCRCIAAPVISGFS